MGKVLEIRDAIHGFIYRDESEQAIIDTPIFQRLRRIKQLALATLVYPGAQHTRFDHSLGVFHVAATMADRVRLDDSEKRLIRLTALLHDIGHGPLSHVSESILEKFADREKLSLKPGQQVHEVLTAAIIKHDPSLARHLCEADREKIIGLLEGSWGDSLLRSIISGPIDADKQDYLLRDSYFCGVRYGVYDLGRLLGALRVNEDADERFLAISADDVHALEQFVLAKYYMATQVYQHRIRLISDAMVTRGIGLGISQDKIPWLRALYSFDGSWEHAKEYLTWDDQRLFSALLDERTGNGYAKDVFQRLMDRRLLKCIFRGRPVDFSDPEARKAAFEASEELLGKVETRVAEQFKFDPNLVIAKIVTFFPGFKKTSATEENITVLHPAGPRLFQDESTLFRAINDATRERFLDIYAPAIYRDSKDKKQKGRDYHKGIIEILNDLVKPRAGSSNQTNNGG